MTVDSSHSAITPSGEGALGRVRAAWPLSWHLIALVVAAFAPATALSGWLLMRHISEAQLQIQTDAIARTEMWAQSIDQALSGAVGTLKALAASAALKNRDFESFGEQALASFNGSGMTVRVRDEKFALLGAGVSNARPTEPLLTPLELETALKSRLPVVTGFRPSEETYPAGLDIWIRAGPKRGEPILLQVRVPSEYLSRTIEPTTIETSWAVALTDSSGNVVASSRSLRQGLGAALAELANVENIAVSKDAPANAPAIVRGVNADGVPVIRATANASVAGWKVVANAPRAALESRLDQHWTGFLAIAALLGCVMAAATSILTTSISRSVSTLSANARSLASGAPLAGIDSSIREVRDLTDAMHDTRAELIRRKAALRDADHRLRMALDAGGMGVWEWDRQTDEMTWDPVEFDLAGLPRGERAPTGTEFASRVFDEDRPKLAEAIAGLTPEEPAFALDFRFRRYDGAQRWLAGRGLLLKFENGAPRSLIGINYDITEQRANADRTAALLREVSHRSKNMLALILAMARLTARDAVDVQTHVKDFSARVAGLAASQDLIVAADWGGVDLSQLAKAQAKAVAHDAGERVHVAGPALRILPEATQTLGMAFAELTLNAVQHGALSAAGGRVELAWSVVDGQLHMKWEEAGGPTLGACDKRGYGMSVIERFTAQGLKAVAEVRTLPTGLVWTLATDLENVGTEEERRNSAVETA